MESKAVRRWVLGQRAAEQRSFQLMRKEGPMSSEASFAAAMELCSLAEMPDHDSVRDKEIAHARALWSKLKMRWAAKHA